jgi:hypothetical protein
MVCPDEVVTPVVEIDWPVRADDHHRRSANLLEAFDEMQHSAEEILASIPTLVQEAVTVSEEIMQDAETLATRSRDLLENEISASWDSGCSAKTLIRIRTDSFIFRSGVPGWKHERANCRHD